jgi:hypothetical protein
MNPPGTNAGSGSISLLGPQFADQGRLNSPDLGHQTDEQNSNREALRLETAVTQRKQRLPISSNREKEACFSPANKRTATATAKVKNAGWQPFAMLRINLRYGVRDEDEGRAGIRARGRQQRASREG